MEFENLTGDDIIKIAKNIILLHFDEEAYLFTDVKNLEYIHFEGRGGYEGEGDLDISSKLLLNPDTVYYDDLRLLVALGKLTMKEASDRYEGARKKSEEQNKKYKEESDQKEYLRLKAKFEK